MTPSSTRPGPFLQRKETNTNAFFVGKDNSRSDTELLTDKKKARPRGKAEQDIIRRAMKEDRVCALLSDEDVESVLETMEYFEFEANDRVVTQGEVGNTFFVVHEGAAAAAARAAHDAAAGATQHVPASGETEVGPSPGTELVFKGVDARRLRALEVEAAVIFQIENSEAAQIAAFTRRWGARTARSTGAFAAGKGRRRNVNALGFRKIIVVAADSWEAVVAVTMCARRHEIVARSTGVVKYQRGPTTNRIAHRWSVSKSGCSIALTAACQLSRTGGCGPAG
ncbi:unnamed protein product [Prorocentrum cordatum]|uniref:Cyclic nucleotide-binding domain-containing protein n=1 Tax=Prorocentrum cordatum TaxID=2364126 RepID=A0ABN9TXL2_9DINO|nr:unnamed protein product [Polarella glacialis]